MESHRDLSSFSSPKQLLEELENLIALELGRNDNHWISVTKLSNLFCKKHRVSLEEVARVQGYSDSLKSLFINSRRFSIYGTQIPQEFYVSLFQLAIPSFYQSQASPAQRVSEYQPILVSEIKSVSDLEIALIEIIKSLTANHPKKFATISILSKKFCAYYKQPIRAVIRSVCPDMKLIELLQTIPNLHIQKVDNDWQITVEAHSVE